jgi:hypothetical protein
MKKIEYCLFTKSVDLPFDGWLQVCYSCNCRITGSLLLLEVIESKEFIKFFKAYFCKDCKHIFKFDDKMKQDFKTKTHEIIYDYLTTGRTKSPITAISIFEET